MSEPDSAATPAPAGRSGALEGQGATSINSGQPGLPGLPGQRRAHSGGVFTRTKLVSTSINPNHQQLVNRLVGMPHQSLSQAQQQSQQQQQKYNIKISDSGQNQNQKHQVLVHQPLVNQYHQSHQHRTTNLVNKVNTNLLTSSSSSGVLSSTIRTHSGGANVFVSPSVNSGLSRKTKTMSMSNVSDVVSNVTVTGGVDNIGVGITDGRSLKRTLSSTEFMNSDSSSSGTYSTGTTSSDVMSGVANKRLKMSDGTVQDTSPPTLGEIVTIVNEEFTTLIKEIREKYNQELLELYHLTTIGHMMDMTQLIKAPKNHIHYYTQYINARQIMPPDEDIDLKVDGTISQTEIKPQLQVQQSNSQAPEKSHHSLPQGAEIKIPGVGVTPVAVSTTLPAAVAQLNQQGGTPLVPEHSNRISISSNSPDRRLSNATLTSSINKSSTASSTPAAGSQEQIVEKAKQEAYVMQRITELQREGLWTEKRLPKQQEPPRLRVHWDYLLEEMVWLATDYAQERKWKKKAAKTCAKMVQKYFQDKAIQAQKAEKAEELHRKKLAAWVSKEIKIFWSNVQKLVEYKQKTRLDETKRRALNQHLSFIVDQTEMYSKLLAEGMNKSSTETPRASDDEFVPNEYSDDDETTIDREEAEMEKHDKTVVIDEVAALQRESELELEDVLNTLPNDYFTNRNETESDSEAEASDSDKDFDASDKDSEDMEDTIDAEERAEQREGKEDSGQEINMLKAESEMDIEELRKKYSRPLSSGPSSPPPFKKQHLDESDDEDDEEIFTDNELSESESEKDVSMNEDIDLKSLLPTDENISKGSQSQLEEDDDSLMNNVAALAESIQPRGNTLSSTNVVTPVPFLLKHTLREYQHIGLDWLVTMFDRKLNGILADEMGLGKTIQTIALLAHLACAKENWGPHLIIVPTSVMLNWEMEIKKWCPGFKILTYYGNQKERKMKRTGWTKPNAFHICITSYKLVIQDHQSFRRKKWKYLILDEAQNIKNFKSQRWQMLLNFQTQQRLLLTGTPLQNNLMELWSLMHFLMPHVFQSHREFKEWFSNPVSGMIEGNSEYNESIIKRLHKVLRPFLLRRLKCEVEKQMPRKFEHVIMCRLSKRQRYLYDDYMDRAKTKETLDSGNLLSVINVLMQLRKVCNHPNLFEVRQTISPFQMESIQYTVPSMVYGMLEYNPFEHIDLFSLNLLLSMTEVFVSALMAHRLKKVFTPKKLIEEIDSSPAPKPEVPRSDSVFYLRWEDPNMLQKRNLGVAVGTSPAMKIDLPPIEEGDVKPSTSGIKAATNSDSRVALSSQQNVNGTSHVHDQLSSGIHALQKPLVASGSHYLQTTTGKQILLNTVHSSSTFNSRGPSSSQQKDNNKANVINEGGNFRSIRLSSENQGCSTITNDVASSESLFSQEGQSCVKLNPQIVTQIVQQYTSNRPSITQAQQMHIQSKFYSAHRQLIRRNRRKHKLALLNKLNQRRCQATPIFGNDGYANCMMTMTNENRLTTLRPFLRTIDERANDIKEYSNSFILYVPKVHACRPQIKVFHPTPSILNAERNLKIRIQSELSVKLRLFHPIVSAMTTQFPETRLIQFDCGKLQTLDALLRNLKRENHRVLIFTQMTKMLDILESFLNYHGHIYLRLDGSTKVDQRQVLMERFNNDQRIFVFILSTRSGGVGINLTGADTVIFYDSDWNPSMDAQAQDRCDRIGQTKDVHIYRLVSEKTIEENILKKANQKRLLGDLAIEGGNFTTAYFKNNTIKDLFLVDRNIDDASTRMSDILEQSKARMNQQLSNPEPVMASTSNDKANKSALGALEHAMVNAEDAQDAFAAKSAKAEAVAELAEFDESIPIEDQNESQTPLSKAEQEIQKILDQKKW